MQRRVGTGGQRSREGAGVAQGGMGALLSGDTGGGHNALHGSMEADLNAPASGDAASAKKPCAHCSFHESPSGKLLAKTAAAYFRMRRMQFCCFLWFRITAALCCSAHW